MQWGVKPHDAAENKSENFGRLPGPLKGQLCKKAHMGDLLPTTYRGLFYFL
jgi:hypothetical protein